MRQTKLIFAITFVVILVLPSIEADAALELRREHEFLLEKYMEGQVKFYNFNGNVLVAKNGRIIYQRSFGYANYDSKELLHKDSLFDTGSIAKQFTAVAILQLKEKGKLSLDDRLEKFFPNLPYTGVTIRQMLTHTSGIPEYFDLMLKKWDLSKVANNNDIVRLLETERPAPYFKPGEDLRYSNTSYDLLASIVQKVSGLSWSDYVAQQLFKPLGITKSKPYNIRIVDRPPVPGIVYGFLYSKIEKKYSLAETLPEYKGIHAFDDIYGSGGINASADELLKWDRALKNHTLISKETQNEMLSVQSTKNSTTPPISFGYGPSLRESDSGRSFFSAGHWPGFRSMYIRYLDSDVTAIVLSNNESQSEYIADALAHVVMDRDLKMPYEPKETRLDPASLERYAGRYMMTKLKQYYGITWPTAIIKKDDRLFVHLEGSPDKEDTELRPESATRFFYADGTDRQIEFETDGSGKPVKVWQITWGMKREVRRLE